MAASLIAFNYLGIVFSSSMYSVSVSASVRLPPCLSRCLPVGQAGGGGGLELLLLLWCVRWSLILSAC